MRGLTLLPLALALACGPDDDPRVSLAPTGQGELPPAILGRGGDLEGAEVRYLPGDPSTVGHLAVPEGAGPFPALVIVHAWNGLDRRTRQLADDLAAEGYVTLAVDLYSGRMARDVEESRVLSEAVRSDMPRVIANLNAAVAYVKARPDVTGRVGAMGWCFGGGIALSFGLDGADHDATAIFYGDLVNDPAILARMDHEIYGTFARLDDRPAPAEVEAFAAALDAAGVPHDLHVYDEVQHGFWFYIEEDPERKAPPALHAWERLKAYLDRTLRD